MAKKVFIAEFDADGKAYFKTLDDMERKTIASSKRMQDSYSVLNSSIVKLAGSLGALTFAMQSIDKFIESQKNLEKLERTVGKLSNTTRNWINNLELVSRYGDEEITSAMSRIGAYVKEEKLLKQLTEATIDFAAAKDMDLTQASELVTKSIISGTNALSRYGIQIDETATPLVRINQLLEQFKLFQDQGKLSTDSQVDSIIKLKKELENVEEELGKNLLPVYNTLLQTLNQIIYAFKVLFEVIGGERNFSDLWMPIDKLMDADKRRQEQSAKFLDDLKKNGWMGASLKPTSFDSVRDNIISMLGGVIGFEPVEKNKNPKEKKRRLPDDLGNVKMRWFEQAALEEMKNKMMVLPVFMAEEFANQMQESLWKGTSIDDIIRQWGGEAAADFNRKFAEVQNIARSVQSIFNITADSFVGKLISGVETIAEILSIVKSLKIIFSPMGFAKGGVVTNKNGSISVTPIPSFASGGSFMVPPGYSRDNYPIMVKSGERVDITPVNQMPHISELLKQINNSIQASTLTNVKYKNQPIIVNLSLDGKQLTRQIISNQNTLDKAGLNFNEL